MIKAVDDDEDLYKRIEAAKLKHALKNGSNLELLSTTQSYDANVSKSKKILIVLIVKYIPKFCT